MPFPRSQLSMVLCSKQADWRPTEEMEQGLRAELLHLGLNSHSHLGDASEQLVEGGFRRMAVLKHDRAQLVANHQGGYRVFCSACLELITGAFVRAMQDYRAGGLRRLSCPCCHSDQDLNALDYRPEAAFTSFEVQLHDVQSIVLTQLGQDLFEQYIPELQMILKRQG